MSVPSADRGECHAPAGVREGNFGCNGTTELPPMRRSPKGPAWCGVSVAMWCEEMCSRIGRFRLNANNCNLSTVAKTVS